MSSSSLNLNISSAAAEKTQDYEEAYGPDRYTVKVSYAGVNILKTVVTYDGIDQVVHTALALVDLLREGIEQANAAYELAQKQDF